MRPNTSQQPTRKTELVQWKTNRNATPTKPHDKNPSATRSMLNQTNAMPKSANKLKKHIHSSIPQQDTTQQRVANEFSVIFKNMKEVEGLDNKTLLKKGLDSEKWRKKYRIVTGASFLQTTDFSKPIIQTKDVKVEQVLRECPKIWVTHFKYLEKTMKEEQKKELGEYLMGVYLGQEEDYKFLVDEIGSETGLDRELKQRIINNDIQQDEPMEEVNEVQQLNQPCFALQNQTNVTFGQDSNANYVEEQLEDKENNPNWTNHQEVAQQQQEKPILSSQDITVNQIQSYQDEPSNIQSCQQEPVQEEPLKEESIEEPISVQEENIAELQELTINEQQDEDLNCLDTSQANIDMEVEGAEYIEEQILRYLSNEMMTHFADQIAQEMQQNHDDYRAKVNENADNEEVQVLIPEESKIDFVDPDQQDNNKEDAEMKQFEQQTEDLIVERQEEVEQQLLGVHPSNESLIPPQQPCLATQRTVDPGDFQVISQAIQEVQQVNEEQKQEQVSQPEPSADRNSLKAQYSQPTIVPQIDEQLLEDVMPPPIEEIKINANQMTEVDDHDHYVRPTQSLLGKLPDSSQALFQGGNEADNEDNDKASVAPTTRTGRNKKRRMSPCSMKSGTSMVLRSKKMRLNPYDKEEVEGASYIRYEVIDKKGIKTLVPVRYSIRNADKLNSFTTLKDFERQILNGEIVISDENKSLLEIFGEADRDKVIHHHLHKLKVERADIEEVLIPNIKGENSHALVTLKTNSKHKFNNQDQIILALSKSKTEISADLMMEVRQAVPEVQEFIVLVASEDASKYIREL